MTQQTPPTPPNDVEKRLRLMRYWLVGIFAILFAASTTYYGLWLTPLNVGVGGVISAVWLIWLITAVLCVAVYFLYRYLITRR